MVTHVALLFLPAIALIGAPILARAIGDDLAQRITRAGLVSAVMCALIGVALVLTETAIDDINVTGSVVLALGSILTLTRMSDWESARAWSGTTACSALAAALLLDPNASLAAVVSGVALAIAAALFGSVLRFVDPTAQPPRAAPLAHETATVAVDRSTPSLSEATAPRALSSAPQPAPEDASSRFGPLPPMIPDEHEKPSVNNSAPAREFTPALPDTRQPAETPDAAERPLAPVASTGGFRMRQRSTTETVDEARRRN